MTTLKAILQIHERSMQTSGFSDLPGHVLRDALGDAFLLSENPLYHRVRRMALELGCEFVPAWETYRRASLYELPKILESKTIPYNDAVPTLHRLVQDHDVDDEVEDVPVVLTSYQFHESAHVIADQAFASIHPQTNDERILLAMLCESYANAVESFAVAYVQGPMHEFFFSQSSYIYANPERVELRRRALRKWGATALFRLLWLSYLYSNFLNDDLDPEEFEGAIGFALDQDEINKDDLGLATSLFGAAYELSVDFRIKTARIYLRMLGAAGDLKGEIRQALDFDFTELFLEREGFSEIFAKLAEQTTASLGNVST